jgi:hypothetical protein
MHILKRFRVSEREFHTHIPPPPRGGGARLRRGDGPSLHSCLFVFDF